MSIDLGVVVFGLIGAGAAITTVFLLIRITHFDDEIPKQMDRTSVWLNEIEKELEQGVTNANASPGGVSTSFVPQIVGMASKFSAVKAISDKLETLETDNSLFVKTDLLTVGGLVLTGVLYYGASFPDLANAYDFTTLANAAGALSGSLWALGFYWFYSTYTELSTLSHKIRKKDHSSGSS